MGRVHDSASRMHYGDGHIALRDSEWSIDGYRSEREQDEFQYVGTVLRYTLKHRAGLDRVRIAPSPRRSPYTAPSGSTSFKMNYVNYTVATAFGVGFNSRDGPLLNIWWTCHATGLN